MGIARLLTIITLTGAAFGALDGILLARSTYEWGQIREIGQAVASCIALDVIAAALFALPALIVIFVWRHLPAPVESRVASARRKLLSWWLSVDVVNLHAAVISVVVVLAVLMQLMAALLFRLSRVDDTRFVVSLTLLLLSVALLMGGLGAVVLYSLLQRPLTYVNRRWGLPYPRMPETRYFVFVFVPTGVILGRFLALHSETLGPLSLPFGLLGFAIAAGGVGLLWRHVAGRYDARVVALMLIGASISLFLLADSRVAKRSVEHAPLGRHVLQIMRASTDMDGDGFSSLFWDGDGAPWNAEINPLATDAPGDGIDQDCDGRATGARGATAEVGDVYYGGLPAAETRRYNVVWIIIDAARADRMHVTGGKRKNTPYLDLLAKESLVFTKAYSQSSATMTSIPSMLSGMNPGNMQWIQAGTRLQVGDSQVMVAERMRDAGYRTGLIVNYYFLTRLRNVVQGYEHVANAWLDNNRKPWYRRPSTIAMVLGLAFLEEDSAVPHSKTPFFLTLYMEDPHEPYFKHAEGFPDFGNRDIDIYDQELANTDRQIGVILEYLRYMRPLWDNTVVIVSADHGEEFGEHGGKFHARTCYRESVRVPLLVRIPGIQAQRIDEPVALIDIVPTLVEVLGLARDASLDGQSLLIPALAPHRVNPARPIYCTTISQKTSMGDFFLMAVRSGNRLLVQDRSRNSYELYDTDKDPFERHPLMEDDATEQISKSLLDLLSRGLTGNLAAQRLVK